MACCIVKDFLQAQLVGICAVILPYLREMEPCRSSCGDEVAVSQLKALFCLTRSIESWSESGKEFLRSSASFFRESFLRAFTTTLGDI